MNHSQKKFVKFAAVIPAIAALLATVLFFAVFSRFDNSLPFDNKQSVFADYDMEDVIVAENAMLNKNEIIKSELPIITSNTIIGKINIGSKSLELIYDANPFNAIGKCNVAENGKLPGEVGVSILSCYKSDSLVVKSLEAENIVTVDTIYGKCEYQVIDTYYVDGEENIRALADGIGRAMLIYCDSTKSSGISNNYFVAVCQMTDGVKINP